MAQVLLTTYFLAPLIPTVVASDSFDFAISDTLVRTYFDESNYFHSNGDVDSLTKRSHNEIFVKGMSEERLTPCFSTSPRLAFLKENRHPFRG